MFAVSCRVHSGDIPQPEVMFAMATIDAKLELLVDQLGRSQARYSPASADACGGHGRPPLGGLMSFLTSSRHDEPIATYR